MGSKELRKRNRNKVEEEEQSVKHKGKVENKEKEQSVKHKGKVETKEDEQSVKHNHDCSKRRKTCIEDYHSWAHQKHIGQTRHDTSHEKTREHSQHTLTDNSEYKDRSHSSHNRGKRKARTEDYHSWGHHEHIVGQTSHDTSHTKTREHNHMSAENSANKDISHWSHKGKNHEQHCDNRGKHNTGWRLEEFRNNTRAGYIRNDINKDWWNDRWCPEKLTPERGDTKGMGLSTMNDNTFQDITTDRWYPERYDKEDPWPSYNKEVEKMQKQQESVGVHRNKGAAAMYEPSSYLFFLSPAFNSCSAALRELSFISNLLFVLLSFDIYTWM